MDDTSWTPSPEDNLFNLTDKDAINEAEARGIASAELFIFGLDVEAPITTTLILEIHRIGFSNLYDWAGKWRMVDINVGQLVPPQPFQIIQLMYQFCDNLNFKIPIAKTKQEHVECLSYAHYEFVRIHPFNNGNGRTGRILMNLVAMKFSYRPLVLYHQQGDSRKIYINAIRAADQGNMELLDRLILNELTVL